MYSYSLIPAYKTVKTLKMHSQRSSRPQSSEGMRKLRAKVSPVVHWYSAAISNSRLLPSRFGGSVTPVKGLVGLS